MFKNIRDAVDLEQDTHVDDLLRVGSDMANAQGAKIGTDLITVASHQPNVGDYPLGTTASRVVRHAACSVFVVRQTG